MRVAFAILDGRIAPLFDTARALLVVDFEEGAATGDSGSFAGSGSPRKRNEVARERPFNGRGCGEGAATGDSGSFAGSGSPRKRNEVAREEMAIPDELPVRKIIRLAGARADILVCGAISGHLEGIISAYGIDLISFVSGPVEEVIAALIAGRLDSPEFAMPGCRRRRRCRRGGNRHGFYRIQ